MAETSSRKKDKNQHIQVFVRVRPANQAEIVGKSSSVVEVSSARDIIVRERPQDKLTKKFSFDRVFGPSSRQLDVYSSVVSPLLDEVLAGYNCTVFAYGQTGTGKTFTMEGVDNDPSVHWQSDSLAGIIPRSLSHLFDELRMLESQEYTVRVSFLELYNEELFDLLSPTDDVQCSKIRIYEDASKKGAVIIHGLEEVTVHNKNEVYKILEKGSERRKTSATLMNANSSRSHTVFSITIHIKENTMDGEELLKTGKLNLVDLAGSENVGRSGAIDRRAREAGNINQSLLTLGRVITALVERAPHIPYRESKLTRLLQESLGGRTKTSIIATVSPASINLEETLSTLDYAHRAKNITNRPEINQKLSKRALLKEYTEEIERLRRDLQATRERNGVYIAQDNYNEMQTTIEYQGKEIEEKISHIKVLEETMAAKEKILHELKMDLDNTKHEVEVTKQARNEQEHLVQKHVVTEKKLFSQAKELLNVVQVATDDTYKLHEKIERKKKVEEENETLGEKFRDNITNQFEDIQREVSKYSQEIIQFCLSAKNQLVDLTEINSKEIDHSIRSITKGLLKSSEAETKKQEKHTNSCAAKYQKLLEESIRNTSSMTDKEVETLKKFFADFSPKIAQLVETDVAENLKKLTNDFSGKLDFLMNHMKTTIDDLSNKLLVDRDRLEKEISLISKSLEDNISAQKTNMEKEEEFRRNFEIMITSYRTLHSDTQLVNEAMIKNSSDSMKVCENVKAGIGQIYSDQIGMKKFIDDDVSSSVEVIKGEFSSQLEENWKLAEQSVQLSKKVFDEMKTELDHNSAELMKFKESFKTKTNELQHGMDVDKSATLSSIKKMNKLISDTSVNHTEFMEKHKQKIETTSSELNRKFENKSSESSEWGNKVTTCLRSTKHHIDKFIMEDIRKDEPTGSTPAKKDFRFPNQLAATSPHEKIINRFRNRRDTFHESLDVDSTIINTDHTMKIISSTPYGNSEKRDSFSPPMTRERKSKEAMCNSNGLVKAASTSDLRNYSLLDSIAIVRSTSDISTKRDNKENGEFVKPDLKPKNSASKLKYPRRILSSHND